MSFKEDLLGYLKGQSYNVVANDLDENQQWSWVDIDTINLEYDTIRKIESIARRNYHVLEEISINHINKKDGLFTVWFSKLNY